MTGFALESCRHLPEGCAPGTVYAVSSKGILSGLPPSALDLKHVPAWVLVDGVRQVMTLVAEEGAEPPAERTLWFNAALVALLVRGGLLLHASGAALHGCGLLLLGLSGVGKSTLAGFLEAEFPGSVLCDERIALKPNTEFVAPELPRWTLAGTPWPSSAGIARQNEAPLTALVFLEQGTEDAVHPITAQEALGRLLPLVSVEWMQRGMIELGVGVLDKLLGSVPAFVFRFTKSPAAARTLDTWVRTL